MDDDTQEADPEYFVSPPPPAQKNSWGRLVSTHPDSKTIELTSDPFSIGRKHSCNFVLTDGRISGLHCTIRTGRHELTGEPVVFLDDSSTNGTFVNRQMVGHGKEAPKSVILKNGDSISLITKEACGPFAYSFYDYKVEATDNEMNAKYIIKDSLLGTGNFSVVKLCVSKHTGDSFAVKIVDKRKYWHCSKTKEQILSEVSILKKIKHPNIISIIEVFDTARYLYIILEFANGGELFDKICEKRYYAEAEAKDVFKQILSGVAYLHNMNITHRDLKPENILLNVKDDISTVKITDFGLARMIGESEIATTLCGTPLYVAPEVLMHGMCMQGDPLAKSAQQGYGKEVDVWSLGCILYVLLSGKTPFDDDESKPVRLWEQIRLGQYDFEGERWSKTSDQAKDLVSKLMNVDPTSRITVSKALKHPWFFKSQPLIDKSEIMKKSRSMSSFSVKSTNKHHSSMDNNGTNNMTSRKRSPPRLRQPYTSDEEADSTDSVSPVKDVQSLSQEMKKLKADGPTAKPTQPPPSSTVNAKAATAANNQVASPAKPPKRSLSLAKPNGSLPNKNTSKPDPSSSLQVGSDNGDVHMEDAPTSNSVNDANSHLNPSASHMKFVVSGPPANSSNNAINKNTPDSGVKAGREGGALKASSFRGKATLRGHNASNRRGSTDRTSLRQSIEKTNTPTRRSSRLNPVNNALNTTGEDDTNLIIVGNTPDDEIKKDVARDANVIIVSDSDSDSDSGNSKSTRKSTKKCAETNENTESNILGTANGDEPKRAYKRLKKRNGSASAS